MKKQVIVISLGGSIIIPDKVNYSFLNKFREVINKNLKKYKFIIVCGGGSLARKYIEALSKQSYIFQSSAGIAATRANAKFVSCFFNQDPLHQIPITLKKIKKLIKRNDLVISGALEFKPKQTTDSNAVEIAAFFHAPFVNLTNVQGLYDKNPKEYKDVKFISKISWKDMHKMATKLSFKPGQHFVIDQVSSKILMDKKVPAYIMGLNLKNFDNFLKSKKFKGTTIQG